MQLKQTIVGLAGVYLVGRLLGRGFTYGTNVIIARSFGPEALGIFALALVVLTTGSLFGRVGLDEAVQRFVPIYVVREDHEKLRGLVQIGVTVPLILGTGIALALYAIRGVAISVVGPGVIDDIWPFLAAIPVHAAMVVLTDFTRGFKETKYVVLIRNFIQAGGALLGAVIGAYLFESLMFVFVTYLLSVVVAFIVASSVVARRPALRGVSSRHEPRRIFTFALPLMAVTAVGIVFYRVDIVMLGILSSADRVGWYQAAFTTALILTTATEAATAIFPTIVSEAHETNSLGRLETTYTVIAKWTSALTAAGFLGLLVYGRDVISLFDITAPSAVVALVVLAAAQFVSAFTGPGAQLLKMSGYERLVVLNTTGLLVVNVGLNYLLIMRFGVPGAAVATAISLVAINVLQAFEVWHFLDIHPYSRAYWKGAIAVAATVPVLLLIQHILPIGVVRVAVAAVGSLAVFGQTWRLLGLDPEDRVVVESLQ